LVALGNGINAATCEVSIISLMANVPHLRNIAHPVTAVEKRLSERMLKTAAALQQISAGKGAYFAKPATVSPALRSNLLPVGYQPAN
jgi:hypothetical protein